MYNVHINKFFLLSPITPSAFFLGLPTSLIRRRTFDDARPVPQEFFLFLLICVLILLEKKHLPSLCNIFFLFLLSHWSRSLHSKSWCLMFDEQPQPTIPGKMLEKLQGSDKPCCWWLMVWTCCHLNLNDPVARLPAPTCDSIPSIDFFYFPARQNPA